MRRLSGNICKIRREKVLQSGAQAYSIRIPVTRSELRLRRLYFSEQRLLYPSGSWLVPGLSRPELYRRGRDDARRSVR